jgi:hypothetical protein
MVLRNFTYNIDREHMRILAIIFLTFLFSSVVSVAQAQEAPSALAPSASTETKATDQKPAQGSAKIGAWQASFTVDEKGNSLTLLRLPASQPYKNRNGKELVPDFVLSCSQHNTYVYIDMKDPVGGADDETIGLQYAFKGAFPIVVSWNLFNNRTFVSSPKPNDFIQEMNGKEVLNFEISSNKSGPVRAYFALDALDEVFKLMAERCFE